MNNELVEIARFPSSFEASLALRELEEAGIPARLTGEASAEWMTYLGTQDVGVGILTNSRDAKKARALLGRDEPKGASQDDIEAGQMGEREEAEQSTADKEPRHWEKRALLSAIFGFFMFPFSLYAIWILVRHNLLSKRNVPSVGFPLTALAVAIVGLVLNLLLIVGQFFQW